MCYNITRIHSITIMKHVYIMRHCIKVILIFLLYLPPSIYTHAPVMYELLADARNVITSPASTKTENVQILIIYKY